MAFSSKSSEHADAALARTRAFEDAHAEGAIAKDIVEHFERIGDPISEATFRKYVQLGLLPRSIRVGQKGRGRGSHGIYPRGTATRVLWVRRWMSEGYTMDEIQHEFLLVRDDLDTLSALAEKVLAALKKHAGFSSRDAAIAAQMEEALRLKNALIHELSKLEEKLSLRARIARAVV